MRCVLFYGDNSANPPKPARLVVPLERTLRWNTSPSNTGTVKFMLANVKNPDVVSMNVGV